MGRRQKLVSVATASDLLQVIWPDFVEVNECIFASFQWHGNYSGDFKDKTATESFINHTHILDEFRNRATFELREPVSKDLDLLEKIFDATHPDFVGACKLGRTIAKMWAIKLNADFPKDRFRIYYTQYDNPIVRFHKVRPNEYEWLSDEGLRTATDPSFREAAIYDTDHLDVVVVKGSE
jgi:hypothetical protein